jgi:glycopeptide antibiotics resistance protein
VLTVAGVFAVVLAVPLLPDVPYNVRQLFPQRHAEAHAFVFSLLLVWIGLAPTWAASVLVSRPKQLPFLPVWAALAGLVSWSLLSFSVTIESLKDILGTMGRDWSSHWALIGRFLALQAPVMLMLLVAAVTAASARKGGAKLARRNGACAMVAALPWLVVGWVVVIRWATTDNLTELIRSRPWVWAGPLALTALAGLFAAHVAAMVNAWAHVGLRRKLAVLALTPMLAGAAWGLLYLGFEPAVRKYGLTFPAIRFLLGPDRKVPLAWDELFLRWMALYIGLVVVASLGGLIALHLRPRLPAQEDRDEASRGPSDNRSLARRARVAFRIGAVIWLAYLVYGSLMPFDFGAMSFEQAWRTFWHSPHLLRSQWSHSDMVTNILAFVPLTFLAMGGWSPHPGDLRGLLGALPILATGLLISLSLEFNQLFVSRTPSIHDIISQTIGNIVGIGAWRTFGPALVRAGGSFLGWRGRRRCVKVLCAYLVVVALFELFPWDFTISTSQIWRKYKAGGISLVPFSEPSAMAYYLSAANAMLYLPVGCLAAIWGARRRHPLTMALAGGVLSSAAAEALQVMVPSRFTSATDVVLAALWAGGGGLIGLGAVRLARRSNAPNG